MSALEYPYPPEPLVEKNNFRHASYTRQSFPAFIEIKEQLPIPILPDHGDWLEMYWRAWEMVWNRLQSPKSNSPLIANFMDVHNTGWLSMWDMAFAVQFGVYGRFHFDFISTLNNFYGRQHPYGFISSQIKTDTGDDLFTPFDPNVSGPNLLAWAEWRYFRMTGDDSRLEQVFWPLLAHHHWCRANRTWPNGLYWATGISSGMSNQPRVPDSMYHHRHWTWIDANLQAALNCQILSKMATLLKEETAAAALTEEHSKLVQKINEQLWNDEHKFYQDVSPDGRFSSVKSIGAYWALLDKEMIPADRLEPFIQPLRETWAFNLPHRIPSQSADSDGYNMSTGHGWRGGVWPTTNFMVLQGLHTQGKARLSHHIAINHLQNVCDTFIHSDTFWENYAPEQAAPGDPAQPNSALTAGLSAIAILLEDVIGIRVDWPLRRVVWDRQLETEGIYGVQNYPLGNENKMSLLGDKTTVSVATDAPFTLTIRDETQSLQTAVPVGVSEISLE